MLNSALVRKTVVVVFSLTGILSQVAWADPLPSAAPAATPRARARATTTQQQASAGLPEAASTTSSQSQGEMPWLTSSDLKGMFFSIPNGGDPTIGVAFFSDPYHSLRIGFGLDLNHMSPQGDWGFSIDAAYRSYIKSIHNLRLYVQPELFIAEAASQTGSFGSNFSIAPSYGIGAEFYVAPSFSVGVGTGLSLTFSNNFNNIRLTTGTTAITGNFYW